VPHRTTAAQLGAAAALGWVSPQAIADLQAAHALFSKVQGAARLLSDDTMDPDIIGTGGRAFLARVTGQPDAATLARHLDKTRANALGWIDSVFGPATPKETA
jgi:glutamate-ammonia-ligase adenylyltransferase